MNKTEKPLLQEDFTMQAFNEFVETLKEFGAKKTLNILYSRKKIPTIDRTAYEVLSVVCDEFQITMETVLVSKDKSQNRYYATAVFCYLMFNNFEYKIKELTAILKKTRQHCYRLINTVDNLNTNHKSIAWVIEKKAKLEILTNKLNKNERSN